MERAHPPEAGAASQPGPSAVLRWAAWFGLVSGTLELAVFLLKCHYLDPRNYDVSRHFPWMFPASGLIVVAGPGLLLAAVARLRGGRVPASAVLGVLSFLAYLGILFRGPIFTVACLVLAAGLSASTARVLSRRASSFDRVVRRSLAALTALFVATVVACHAGGSLVEHRARARVPRRPPGAKNVILVVLDTVRAESLGLYGYRRDTSPHLARLAERGVRFDRAFATAPWTAPSHASLFTGRWVHELSVAWDRPLDRTYPTLAEYLSARGYATAGFVANSTYCSYETGLDRGFAHYEDYDVSLRGVVLCSALVQRTVNFVHKHPRLAALLGEDRSADGHRKDASRIGRDFLGWLSRVGDRPFFAFLNYFDAHHPYLSPDSCGGATLGRVPGSPSEYRMLRGWWGLDKRRLSASDVELARDSYDRCIAYLDRELGRLFDELGRRGRLDDTLVILTADHGEHLGEQGLFGHGCSLYRPELHVPLIVLDPGSAPAGKVVHHPVSLRDVPATVVDRLGLGSGSPFPGRSLAAAWSDDPSPPGSDEPLLSEVASAPESDPNAGGSPVRRGPMRSLVGWGYHYIRNGDGREELYELDGDPAEARDLAGAPQLTSTLRRFRTTLSR